MHIEVRVLLARSDLGNADYKLGPRGRRHNPRSTPRASAPPPSWVGRYLSQSGGTHYGHCGVTRDTALCVSWPKIRLGPWGGTAGSGSDASDPTAQICSMLLPMRRQPDLRSSITRDRYARQAVHRYRASLYAKRKV